MDPIINTEAPLEALNSHWQLFFIILYSLTAIIAFTFNLLTIIVLVKGHQCTHDLRQFLLNLAIADLAMSMTTIPFTYTTYMFGQWIFPSIMCPLVNVAQLTTITASIWLLVVIAFDRYFAILHPLKHSNSHFKRHYRLIVTFIWLFGLSIGLTQVWVTKVGTFMHNKRWYLSCGERWKPKSTEGQLYTSFIFAVTFVLPIGILVFLHTVMYCRLVSHKVPGEEKRKASLRREGDDGDEEDEDEDDYLQTPKGLKDTQSLGTRINSTKRNKVLKMLITIVVVFTISWLPIQLFNIFIYFLPNFLRVHSSTQYNCFVLSYFICHWMSCAHSFMNAIILFMSKKFRKDIHDISRYFWYTYILRKKRKQSGYNSKWIHSNGVNQQLAMQHLSNGHQHHSLSTDNNQINPKMSLNSIHIISQV